MELSGCSSVIHFRTDIGGLPVVCTINPYTLTAKPSSTVTERHSHSFYELLYIKQGHGTLVTDEEERAYGDHYACLISPYVYHTRNGGSAEEFLSIKFEPDKERTEALRVQKDVSAAFAYLNAQGVFTLKEHTRLTPLLGALIAELRDAKSFRSLVLGGLMAGILAVFLQEMLIARGGNAQEEKSLEEESSLARRAAIIDCFFDQVDNANSTMEDLCRLIHVSPGQLNRIIKAQYGKTFKQKLIDMRIEYMKHLLEHTSLKIPEITAMTNFSSEGNLSQFFKKHCGISPTAYRRQKRHKLTAPAVQKQSRETDE